MWVIFYLLSIPALNLAFGVLPKLSLPGGGVFPVAALLAGCVFVLRDYAQREAGTLVVGAMVSGAVLSYVVADQNIAVASVLAFAISEVVDWTIYTITRRPFADRILFSSIVSVPIDTAVFLWLLPFDNALNWIAFLLVSLAKMVAALIVFVSYRRREFMHLSV